MTMCGLSKQDTIFDGSDADYDYAIKKDGLPLQSIVSIQYKLSDSDSELIEWTDIIPPNDSGTINIPGINNKILDPSRKKRELALYIIYSGDKVATSKTTYTITEIIGVTPISP